MVGVGGLDYIYMHTLLKKLDNTKSKKSKAFIHILFFLTYFSCVSLFFLRSLFYYYHFFVTLLGIL